MLTRVWTATLIRIKKKHHKQVSPTGSSDCVRKFNANLGALGGIRGKGAANVQDMLISDLMAHAISVLYHLAVLPDYTYFSGDVCSTVDYVFAGAILSLMSGCVVTEMEDLNTSDHICRHC